ncbi:MAG: carboxypeptidase-like regulatory domain-containing protein, partial [Planctomycetaceae bacterium]
ILSSAIITLAGLVLAGCGGGDQPETYPVVGTVTLDGEPVDRAHVIFHPENPAQGGVTARGQTDESGAYQLTTFDTGDGAVAGTYTVTISKVDAGETETMEVDLDDPGAAYDEMMTTGDPTVDVENQLPADYASPATSPEKRTVKEDENEFNFDLKSE